MKHRTSWDHHAKRYSINQSIFMRLIARFVNKIVDNCVKNFVAHVAKQSTMMYHGECETFFKTLSYALKVLYVSAQKAIRSTGIIQTGKEFFFVLHITYEYQVEVVVDRMN